MVTRLSGGDVKVSRYIFGAGRVRVISPPVVMGRVNRGLEDGIEAGGEYSDLLISDDDDDDVKDGLRFCGVLMELLVAIWRG
jgi:hypothetical protein